MRTIFIISFVANLILVIVSFVLSPPVVAIHFGLGGRPDNWAPAYINALIMTGFYVLFFLMFLFTPRLIRATPSKLISLPNKDYWLREENRNRAEAIISTEIYLFGSLTMALLFIVNLLALKANLSKPVIFNEDLFWGPFILYIVFTIYWTIRFIRKFKIPI